MKVLDKSRRRLTKIFYLFETNTPIMIIALVQELLPKLSSMNLLNLKTIGKKIPNLDRQLHQMADQNQLLSITVPNLSTESMKTTTSPLVPKVVFLDIIMPPPLQSKAKIIQDKV